MGTDISAYIEYKDPKEGHYRLFTEPCLYRSYILFCMLAGVRKSWVADKIDAPVNVIYQPKGFPDDLSQEILEDLDCGSYWDDDEGKWQLDYDGHSASNLSLEELQNVFSQYFELIEGGVQQLQAIIAIMEKLPESRFVFYFDC